MNTTSGAWPTTGLRKREQPKEAKKSEQILTTADVVMKNENNKRSFARNRTQKKRVPEGSKVIRADPSNSRGYDQK